MNQLLFSIFFYMSYSNKCVNFFLYLVSGYKFRLALRQLVRCRRQVFSHLSMGGGGGGAVGIGGGGGGGARGGGRRLSDFSLSGAPSQGDLPSAGC